ncbi:MAG: hypothetical protein ACLU86_03620 [Negativibacillus massiliensis]|uniref:hypothetical protein n=1 Tax=Negativibacillus massiliensis TaxID=1871035 RepID=UPI00399B8EFF
MKHMISTISKILCAVLLLSCVHLNVWAESTNDEIEGIEYESIEELQNCIKTHRSSKHPDQYAYLSSMSQLFIPEILNDNVDRIKGITITQTYVSVDFEVNGQNLEFYHYLSGENQYQIAKGQQEAEANKIYNFYPAKQKVNGHLVYSSYSGATEYCWKQGKEVFGLRTFDEVNPKKRQNFNLCKAISIPLYESVIADDNTLQSIAKKKEKVFFCVIDQNGKPVTNAQFVLPTLQALAPTDTNGKTWYYGKPFEKQNVTVYYTDSNGNDQYLTKIVTVRDSHLKNGKMGITFKVTI